MLENYDTRQRIRELAREFERDHAQQPYSEAYARGTRRAYAALVETAGPERADPELHGMLDAILAAVDEVGLESVRFLLAVEPSEE